MKPSVAIVSGASQGIGRSAAIRLAHDFSAIVLAARNGDALAEVAAAVKSDGAEPLVCDLDLSDVSSPGKLVTRALERFGRIDALLNIAGAVPQIDLFEMTDEQWYGGMELKLHGARRLTLKAGRRSNRHKVRWCSCPGAPRSIQSPPSRPWPLPMPPSRLWRRHLQSKA
jgi:NAD(P)-dependent dehydrogenase (short-subunit alcohol dehydrogenase family)